MINIEIVQKNGQCANYSGNTIPVDHLVKIYYRSDTRNLDELLEEAKPISFFLKEGEVKNVFCSFHVKNGIVRYDTWWYEVPKDTVVTIKHSNGEFYVLSFSSQIITGPWKGGMKFEDLERQLVQDGWNQFDFPIILDEGEEEEDLLEADFLEEEKESEND